MAADNVKVYAACDRAIQAIDRENLEAFGRLKMATWDRINIIQTVVKVYRESAKKARKRYFEVAFEVYVLMMMELGRPASEAHRMAEKAITMAWVDGILEQTDFVTLYRFNSEAERKAYKLAETLEVVQDRDAEINKALRYWSRQLGQYAVNFTDYAAMQAFDDAGVERVMWMTQKDELVCHECGTLDGQVFPLDEVPPKPHMNCRCFWKAVRN